jgi:N-glycosylase/DNA lyase
MLSNIEAGDLANITNIFKSFKKNLNDRETVFYNMCFAICAPQAKFSKNLLVVAKLRELDFYNKNIEDDVLVDIVKNVRFHRKAKYLKTAKTRFSEIFAVLNSNALNSFDKRDMLVKLIPGVGLKAASHFMRNLGYEDFAIIDTHILKFLGAKSPKNRKEYLNLEYKFVILSTVNNLTPGMADAYVWKVYSGTKWEDFKY